MRFRRSAAACVMVVGVIGGGVCGRAAQAADYTYTFAYSAEYSDNVRLVPANEEDELANVFSAGFQVAHNGRELDARAQTRAAYRSYANDTFADDTSFGLTGALVWKPVPDTFHWTVEDVYTQVAADPTVADTPANRVNANVFSTGPDVFWRLSPVQTLQLGGRYATSRFDATENTTATAGAESDNTRRSGTARWLYRSSPVTVFSVAHSSEVVEFDEPATSSTFDFRRAETTAGLANRIGRNNLSVDVGETRIKRMNQAEISGASGRLSWEREMSSGTSVSVTASRSLSDAGEEILTTGDDVGTPTDTASVSTADIFVSRQATVAYSRRSSSNTVAVSVFRSERTYELVRASNETSKGVDVQVSHTFMEAVTGVASARYVETFFPSLPRDDEISAVGVGLQYKFNRTLSGGLAYARESRSSTNPGFEYIENRAVLNIGYNSLPSRW